MADLLKHGATTVFEHHYVFPGLADDHLIDQQMDAASQLGLRFHAFHQREQGQDHQPGRGMDDAISEEACNGSNDQFFPFEN